VSYARSASVYDAIYTNMKDYHSEAERLHVIIQEYLQALGDSLLEVAVGTGLHAQHLLKWYRLEGMDIDSAMLAIARNRLPNVPFHQADMTNFDMGRCYDVVTCLFSAIGHINTYEGLHQAISEMAKHLKPGGVLVVEPFIHPDAFMPGHLSVNHVQYDNLTVVRVNRSIREGYILRLILDHYVCRDGEYEDPFTDVHDVAMYTIEEYIEAFCAAGLEVWHDEQGLMGRGLFIGRKPL
jgi:SAM-dependent methyltransferase